MKRDELLELMKAPEVKVPPFETKKTPPVPTPKNDLNDLRIFAANTWNGCEMQSSRCFCTSLVSTVIFWILWITFLATWQTNLNYHHTQDSLQLTILNRTLTKTPVWWRFGQTLYCPVLEFQHRLCFSTIEEDSCRYDPDDSLGRSLLLRPVYSNTTVFLYYEHFERPLPDTCKLVSSYWSVDWEILFWISLICMGLTIVLSAIFLCMVKIAQRHRQEIHLFDSTFYNQ